MRKQIHSLLVVLSFSFISHADLITIYDTHLLYQSGNIIVQQHPTNGDYTGYGLYPCNVSDPDTYEQGSYLINTWGTFVDEGCNVTFHGYDTFQLAHYGGETYIIGYGDFYFEVSTMYYWYEEQVSGSGFLYMNNSPTEGLKMTGSVMTYNIVPEPASVVLTGLGGVCVWLLRRNKIPPEI